MLAKDKHPVKASRDHHAAAHRFLATEPAWATTPLTETAFVRLVSNPAVVGQDVTPARALALLGRLREQADHRFLADDASLPDSVLDLSALVGHRQVTDLHLVTLAARTGCVLATFDARLVAALAPADRDHARTIPV